MIDKLVYPTYIYICNIPMKWEGNHDNNGDDSNNSKNEKKSWLMGYIPFVNLTACELENHQLVKLGKPSCLSSINVLFSIATT